MLDGVRSGFSDDLGFGFQTTSMLTASNIVKEQIVQTTSKKVLRSSEL